MNGLVFLKLTYLVYSTYPPETYKFRKIMIYSFIAVFSVGKIYESYNLSAYHEDHVQVIYALIFCIVFYGIGRGIGGGVVGRAMTRVLYAMMVGSMEKDVNSSR